MNRFYVSMGGKKVGAVPNWRIYDDRLLEATRSLSKYERLLDSNWYICNVSRSKYE